MKLKAFSVLLSGVLLLSSSICAFAQTETSEDVNGKVIESVVESTTESVIEETGEKPAGMGNIGLTPVLARGTSAPTSAYDWSKGSYPISGDTSMDTWLYTNYYFTNFTDATLKITAYSYSGSNPRGDVNVYIYRKELLGDTVVHASTVSAGTTKTFTMSNYDSSKKYYIKFSGVMNISGSLTKN
ncbi:hypothetical protein [Kineothrix sp. MB12-C1]|uniref:hypothetical protein n=1 Tax=Kineothrix sp. MB12-C1 TaxID=3070215 RepID=UPI0027D2BE69|nr:hypothetical protein [Kineothrix sp. MB12-C1]WMC92193.1 hypothetical protein RBB56_15265 [Kineothrix sp. MB12-C1]